MFEFALIYFLFQPVLHDWCNKYRGMCYPVCGMLRIKEPLLLFEHVCCSFFIYLFDAIYMYSLFYGTFRLRSIILIASNKE